MGLVTRWLRRSPPMLASADAYARWAETYAAEPHNPLMHAEQRVLGPMIASVRPVKAIDVGTGTGRYLPVIAAAGARLVVGFDLSAEMLARQENGRALVRGDAVRLPFRRASVDLVVSSLMLGDVADLDGWIAEVARVLTPGGHLIYSDFHPSWRAARWQRTFRARSGRMYQLPHHTHEFEEHLQALESREFDVREVREPRLGAADAARLDRARRQLPVVVAVHAIRRGQLPVPARG